MPEVSLGVEKVIFGKGGWNHFRAKSDFKFLIGFGPTLPYPTCVFSSNYRFSYLFQ
jgi:hypothetical protein